MFQDLERLAPRYSAGRNNGEIPPTIVFEEYFEIKHHLGENSTNWTSYVVDEYRQRAQTLLFTY